MSRRCFAIAGLLLLSIAMGCRGGMFAEPGQPNTFADSPTDLVASEAVEGNPPQDESPEASMIAIVDELTELGALDDQSKRELMADLRDAKPENWPYIVKMYRSTLAYRKQLNDRQPMADDQFLARHRSRSRDTTSQPLDPPETTPRPRDRREQRFELTADDSQYKQSHAREASYDSDRQPTAKRSLAHSTRQDVDAQPEADARRPQAVVLSKPPRRLSPLQSHDQSPVRPASFQQVADSPADWKSQLQSAVEGMQTSLPTDPVSTDEVNEHMRLRLLQLLAGDQEGAMMPVPGATASQQDYWSQQLFAVSTFLDSQNQPDNKRRATGSLTYLDQARAKLADLATLQVRNLAFVESVGGYGDYALREQTKFRPGDKVILYAEIENFTSISTKQGHHTRLGTSFEILDKNGKRVDSAQFPEVEDLCKTPRRDFHIQYSVKLPTRIYAEEYEIRLIVTDEQSRKIGQASLPFEIAE